MMDEIQFKLTESLLTEFGDQLLSIEGQQSLVGYSGISQDILNFIPFGGSPRQFVTQLVTLLMSYPRQANEQHPLDVVLVGITDLVRKEHRATWQLLCEEMHHAVRSSPELSQGDANAQTPRGHPVDPSADITRKIIQFLCAIPDLATVHTQQNLIEKARLDPQLRWQLRAGHPPVQFATFLVSHLRMYGCLEDGRNALESLLEASKSFVQEPQQQDCDTLIQELRTSRI